MQKRWKLSPSKEKTLYKRAIELLSREFDKMGVEPTLGIEIEFYVHDKENSGIPPIAERELHMLQFQIEQSLRGIPKVRRENMARLYKEVPKDKCKYEVTTHILKPNNVVDAAHAIKAATHGKLRECDNVGRLTFHGSETEFTPGMHVNLGFRVDGKDILLGRDGKLAYYTSQRMIAHHMKAPLAQLMLLFAPKPGSYARLRNTGDEIPTPNEIVVTDGKNHCALRLPKDKTECGLMYIENRLPGADTPTYKAVLGTLLASYVAIKNSARFDERGHVEINDKGALACKAQPKFPSEYPADETVTKTLAESAERFENSRHLWDMIDALSPEEKIGTRIYAHELDRYQAIAFGAPVNTSEPIRI